MASINDKLSQRDKKTRQITMQYALSSSSSSSSSSSLS